MTWADDMMNRNVGAIPSWLPRAIPGARDWEALGNRRYRGRLEFSDAWVYVGVDEAGRWVSTPVLEQMLKDWGREATEEWIFRQIGLSLADMALPKCVVPDCTSKGRVQYAAAEDGRLAGRDWHRGELINLCPSHGDDVYRAQSVEGLDQLAEWLHPDARLDVLSEYDEATDIIFRFDEADKHRRALRVVKV